MVQQNGCSLEINFKPLDNRDYQVKVKKSTITAECRSMQIACRHHVHLDGSFIVVCWSVSVLLHRRVALGAGQPGGQDHEHDAASSQHGRWESTGRAPLLPGTIYLRLFYPTCSLSTHTYKRCQMESTLLTFQKALVPGTFSFKEAHTVA